MGENEENTPGKQAIAVMEDHKVSIFKKPFSAPRKKEKQKILDEDTYVEKIGEIIQRDFFPDLEKLKAQNEYLEAEEKNDVLKMRQIYMKYSGKRPDTGRVPSPATFETPAVHRTPQIQEPSLSEFSEENIKSEKKALSLDQFLNSHTSQDNQSFTEILTESDKKHKEKFSYLYNEEDKSENDKLKQLALPTVEQQCAIAEKKFNIDTWGYKNRNYIMYIPDGVDLTKEQEVEILKKRQEVVHSNTRLDRNPFNDSQSKETINELAKSQAKILDGKIGVDGKEMIKNETPKIRGFGFVKTPSPMPGVMYSPLMTWGEIEGTPFRLDGGDTPLPSRSQGPAFKMAEPPRREQLALQLAEKVGEKNRDRKQKAMDAARRRLATPSPRMDRLATMSPAARRLATTQLKLGGSTGDFRASFSPSPKPKSTPSTPKINLGIKRNDSNNDNLTDDLLKIDISKRKRAADFF